MGRQLGENTAGRSACTGRDREVTTRVSMQGQWRSVSWRLFGRPRRMVREGERGAPCYPFFAPFGTEGGENAVLGKSFLSPASSGSCQLFTSNTHSSATSSWH